MPQIIDTHVHVWDLKKAGYPWLDNDTSILKQTWKIEQLEEERVAAGIDYGILVQASGNMEDTALMFETAQQASWIKGIVAWLPLMNPNAAMEILDIQLQKEPLFKGVRHQVHDEPDTKWLLQPAVIDSLAILEQNNIPFDVVAVVPEHIETALKVAEQLPDLKMVFDHLSQPPIKTKEQFGRWGELMKAAAQHKNFYAKISGLGTASGNWTEWSAGDVKPYIEFALEYFGAGRCFCGGDWPVSLLAGTYRKAWTIYGEVINSLLNQEESEQVFYHNAKQFYQL
ncbi:MAG: amidohydrolase family protein [Bacteroidetes bacterium]|nr:amidohydrolase family protein [Bacteroidota bacterium]